MAAYKEASLHIREIFARYTPLIELLSLDEAYLDVSDCSRAVVQKHLNWYHGKFANRALRMSLI